MYKAEIIEDNLCTDTGERLTSFIVSYPRFVHAELMTHRMFSRNSSSSRAIPNARMISHIEQDPVIPVWWGKNQKGMQAVAEIDNKFAAETAWLEARDVMLGYSRRLAKLGMHKQIANRLLEPWMFITVLITATEYDNFFHLRTSQVDHLPHNLSFDPEFPAQPEIQKIARMMWELHNEQTPTPVEVGYWHLPFVTKEERNTLSLDVRQKLSVARCARVSYLNHDGTQDPESDKRLYMQLSTAGHWSPFEHIAQAQETDARFGNLFGWKQYRKQFSNENAGRKLD
jgi:thymidylate synthase ThyX